MTRTGDPPEVVLDLSRLLSRIHHATPTGVDRVEMAYARALDARLPGRLHFAAAHPFGGYGRLPRDVVMRFLDQTERRWDDGGDNGLPLGGRLNGRILGALWTMRPRPVPPPAATRILVQSSPHHLDDETKIAAILARERARFICLLHDLIPIEYPEYARPNGAAQHLRRVRTVARHAAGVIANSQATLDAFRPYLAEAGREVALGVAHLGVAPPAAVKPHDGGRPYFLCLGTIEPRKNHLLLLNLWRRMAETRGPAAVPRLMIVGRRGWENEQIVDMLDRCPALKHCVEEHAGLADADVAARIAGAHTLLLPSFAEGYGLPVPEALAHGTPVICSDLPALREAGGDVPDYLDPLDGPGWLAAIDDHLAGGPMRAAQLRRLAAWEPPAWDRHFDVAVAMIDALR